MAKGKLSRATAAQAGGLELPSPPLAQESREGISKVMSPMSSPNVLMNPSMVEPGLWLPPCCLSLGSGQVIMLGLWFTAFSWCWLQRCPWLEQCYLNPALSMSLGTRLRASVLASPQKAAVNVEVIRAVSWLGGERREEDVVWGKLRVSVSQPAEPCAGQSFPLD